MSKEGYLGRFNLNNVSRRDWFTLMGYVSAAAAVSACTRGPSQGEIKQTEIAIWNDEPPPKIPENYTFPQTVRLNVEQLTNRFTVLKNGAKDGDLTSASFQTLTDLREGKKSVREALVKIGRDPLLHVHTVGKDENQSAMAHFAADSEDKYPDITVKTYSGDYNLVKFLKAGIDLQDPEFMHKNLQLSDYGISLYALKELLQLACFEGIANAATENMLIKIKLPFKIVKNTQVIASESNIDERTKQELGYYLLFTQGTQAGTSVWKRADALPVAILVPNIIASTRNGSVSRDEVLGTPGFLSDVAYYMDAQSINGKSLISIMDKQFTASLRQEQSIQPDQDIVSKILMDTNLAPHLEKISDMINPQRSRSISQPALADRFYADYHPKVFQVPQFIFQA